MDTLSKAEHDLLTPNEVATRLRCTTRFVRRLVSERRIEFVKVGRSVKFRPNAIDDYIERHRFPPLSRKELRESLLVGA